MIDDEQFYRLMAKHSKKLVSMIGFEPYFIYTIVKYLSDSRQLDEKDFKLVRKNICKIEGKIAYNYLMGRKFNKDEVYLEILPVINKLSKHSKKAIIDMAINNIMNSIQDEDITIIMNYTRKFLHTIDDIIIEKDENTNLLKYRIKSKDIKGNQYVIDVTYSFPTYFQIYIHK